MEFLNPITTNTDLLALIGFVFSLIAYQLAKPLAVKMGLVDLPDKKGGRKRHEGAIPLIGGLVIVLMFWLLGALAGLNDINNDLFIYGTLPFNYLMGGVLFLLAIGIVDDKANVHPWARFVIQFWLAAYIVVFCGAEINNLGNLLGFGDIQLGYITKPFSVVCFVLFMNAFNMMDGLDGLAGGIAAIILGWLMVIFTKYDAPLYAAAILLLLAPIYAFLFYNYRHPFRKKASIFLGDAGSLSLALLIGFFAMSAAKNVGGEFMIPPVVIIWLFGVPVIDAFSLFFVRLKNGRHPFQPDRNHIHYKLIDWGFSPAQATNALLALTFLFCAIGYLGHKAGAPDYVLCYSWSAILLGYTFYNLKHDKI